MQEALRLNFRAMASPCEILLEGPAVDRDRAAAQAAAQAAVDEVLRIEARYSRYRDDSILSRINRAAGQPVPVPLDEETASLAGFAATLHAQSGGRFDATSGVLRRAWDFKSGRPPTQQALDALLPLVGWDRVELGPAGMRLPEAGMELDFGGIGKEYAADRAAGVLLARGYVHGYVNLGGDLRVVGPRADGSAWNFGIQHPRRPGEVIASVRLLRGALATSGDYERFLIHEGRRYCHILDARSGWPCSHWQSVSVVAPACVAAGALSTIAMLSGDEAPDFLRTQQVSFLAVDAQGGRHTGGDFGPQGGG